MDKREFTKEHREKLRLSHLGHTPWNKGRVLIRHEKQCPECKNTFSSRVKHRIYCSTSCSSKNKVMSEDGKKRVSIANKGKKYTLGRRYSMSAETRLKLSLSKRGYKSYMWRGGITPINKAIRNRTEYRLWREAVFARDNWTCQVCSGRGVYLNADHIKPFAVFPELRFAIDNGQTLCAKCHKMKTKKDIPIIRSMQKILIK